MYQVSLGVSGVVCPVAMYLLVARGVSPTEHSFSPSLPHSLSIRNKDKCGSQPACLNHVQERRRPLKTHQSESFLPLGMYHPLSLTHSAAVRGCTALTSLQKTCFREHAFFLHRGGNISKANVNIFFFKTLLCTLSTQK